MIIKKSSRFIALLLVALTLNVYSMKRVHPEETSPWVGTVGAILLDEAHIKDLLQFTDLPPEILERIIYLLSANEGAQFLEEAAKDINSLALVNKDLNEFINHPSFCLHLIKHISQKFHCTDEEVAVSLQTKEAQRRFELQSKLFEECVIKEFNIEILEELLKEGADINFTYTMTASGELLMEVYWERHDPLPVIQWLVEHGANQDQQNHLLRWVIADCDAGTIRKDQFEIIKILLNASADPEITDDKGNSMLSLAEKFLHDWQQYYDEHKYGPYDLSKDLEDINKITTVIKMLEDAIKRKRKLGY